MFFFPPSSVVGFVRHLWAHFMQSRSNSAQKYLIINFSDDFQKKYYVTTFILMCSCRKRFTFIHIHEILWMMRGEHTRNTTWRRDIKVKRYEGGKMTVIDEATTSIVSLGETACLGV